MDALTVIEKIEKVAKNTRVERREPSAKEFQIGKRVRQGDVYLTRVPEDWPHGEERTNRQIADGTSIGARHCIAKSQDVKVYEPAPNAADLMVNAKYAKRVPLGLACGPVIVAKGRALNTHPEHAHFSLPAGVYQTSYQVDARTRRRVID